MLNKVLFETIPRHPSNLADILQYNLRTLMSLREHDLQDRRAITAPTAKIKSSYNDVGA